MSRRFEIAPQARADIAEITAYLSANAGPRTASAVRKRFKASILSIRLSPLTGAPRYELGENTRIVVSQRWLIYYRVTSDACQIIRVLDSAQDAVRIFGVAETPL